MDRSSYGPRRPLPDSVGNIIEKFILPYFRKISIRRYIIWFNAIINEVEKEYNIELGREEDEELYYLGMIMVI